MIIGGGIGALLGSIIGEIIHDENSIALQVMIGFGAFGIIIGWEKLVNKPRYEKWKGEKIIWDQATKDGPNFTIALEMIVYFSQNLGKQCLLRRCHQLIMFVYGLSPSPNPSVINNHPIIPCRQSIPTLPPNSGKPVCLLIGSSHNISINPSTQTLLGL